MKASEMKMTDPVRTMRRKIRNGVQEKQTIPAVDSAADQPDEPYKWRSFRHAEDDLSDVTPDIRAKIHNWD